MTFACGFRVGANQTCRDRASLQLSRKSLTDLVKQNVCVYYAARSFHDYYFGRIYKVWPRSIRLPLTLTSTGALTHWKSKITFRTLWVCGRSPKPPFAAFTKTPLWPVLFHAIVDLRGDRMMPVRGQSIGLLLLLVFLTFSVHLSRMNAVKSSWHVLRFFLSSAVFHSGFPLDKLSPLSTSFNSSFFLIIVSRFRQDIIL